MLQEHAVMPRYTARLLYLKMAIRQRVLAAVLLLQPHPRRVPVGRFRQPLREVAARLRLPGAARCQAKARLVLQRLTVNARRITGQSLLQQAKVTKRKVVVVAATVRVDAKTPKLRRRLQCVWPLSRLRQYVQKISTSYRRVIRAA